MFKNNRGFTLIEMLIVLLIISVLIILIIPNLAGKSKNVHDKGCEALVSIVQTQVEAYHLEEGDNPQNLDQLVAKKYITKEQKTCPNKKPIHYDGQIVKAGSTN